MQGSRTHNNKYDPSRQHWNLNGTNELDASSNEHLSKNGPSLTEWNDNHVTWDCYPLLCNASAPRAHHLRRHPCSPSGSQTRSKASATVSKCSQAPIISFRTFTHKIIKDLEDGPGGRWTVGSSRYHGIQVLVRTIVLPTDLLRLIFKDPPGRMKVYSPGCCHQCHCQVSPSLPFHFLWYHNLSLRFSCTDMEFGHPYGSKIFACPFLHRYWHHANLIYFGGSSHLWAHYGWWADEYGCARGLSVVAAFISGVA